MPRAPLISSLVFQHVLQHGKPEGRSSIVTQLAGQIVKMSLQKFASNVVEKCLTFGSPEERQILINEMLGTNDENEPLQVCFQPSLLVLYHITCSIIGKVEE
jgi:hypothetical protein